MPHADAPSSDAPTDPPLTHHRSTYHRQTRRRPRRCRLTCRRPTRRRPARHRRDSDDYHRDACGVRLRVPVVLVARASRMYLGMYSIGCVLRYKTYTNVLVSRARKIYPITVCVAFDLKISILST